MSACEVAEMDDLLAELDHDEPFEPGDVVVAAVDAPIRSTRPSRRALRDRICLDGFADQRPDTGSTNQAPRLS
jgi:hypothetical protein